VSREDVRDKVGTLLYVEGRIVFGDQPDVRLFTRWSPTKAAIELHAEGIWRGKHGPQELLDDCRMEVWAELIFTDGTMAARIVAREFYAAIQGEYLSTFSWGRVHV
jgi:hypothetical protein